MNRRLYVAYGSNLNRRQMAMRCPTAKLVGTGIIENYELQFKGSQHSAFATISPKEGVHVPVAVWDIKPMDERSLDIYEGFPSHYYKENVPVKLNMNNKGKPIESEVSAMVYVMNQKMEFGIPSNLYYTTVLEGYENCGLDTKILNQAVDESIEKYVASARQYDKNTIYNPDYGEDYSDENMLSEEVPDEDSPFFSSDQMQM